MVFVKRTVFLVFFALLLCPASPRAQSLGYADPETVGFSRERLDPERLMLDIKTSGKIGAYLPDVDSIVEHVKKNAEGGDVVCVFSNGGFGGIHSKLLQRLGRP